MGRTICIVAPLTGMLGPVSGRQDCGQCYQVELSVVVALVSCDILLTVLIALSVYCCVSRQRSRPGLHTQPSDTGKGKQLTASKKAKKTEVTESPYQELYGVQSDVYSDLRQYRK
ncbi:TYRO protein tyrosine kinase-binding protein isoform X2 [Clupea harengus]|uniref:TYRO protein tyrosine kinase-binding protein n=1 Tax=Clupea harengus TaxID=7950 RepID=A0A6P3VK34_CLUHA|nr:TYRO protein tyrosine kinase-binding protein isoform X2 [Clupea harengus]